MMGAHYANYLDFYERGAYAPYLTEHRVAGSAPVRMVAVSEPRGIYHNPPTPDLTIQMCIRGGAKAAVDVGCGRTSFWSVPGQIVVQPHDGAGEYVLDGPHDILVVALPFAELHPILEETAPGFRDFGPLHDATPIRDPFLETLCRRLWQEAADGNPCGSLFADGAVMALAAALLRLNDRHAAAPAAGAPALSPARLRRIVEFVEARIDADLTLRDLAAVAGMSVSGFARAFKATTGLTPYRYLTERRIERAKTLLRDGNASVTEVALTCGFANPQHFATVFKRLVGASPRAFRQEA